MPRYRRRAGDWRRRDEEEGLEGLFDRRLGKSLGPLELERGGVVLVALSTSIRRSGDSCTTF
ncbi:MAG: hypothetical protein OXC93_11530 [Rhodospirillaceae bacterium]|nr:hypothetical protein [Rhodospirillaceae bacterium]